MKRTVAIAYTVAVVFVIVAVVGFFGWRNYQIRAQRIADFTVRTKEYARLLSESLLSDGDVNAELKAAESLMDTDPTLIAVQVYSRDDGLRLSVVKPLTEELLSEPLAESDPFSGIVDGIRFHAVAQPMAVENMEGLEANFAAVTLTAAEIRNDLLIVLIVVLIFFAVTLGLVLIRPRGTVPDDEFAKENEDEYSLPDDDFDAVSAQERTPGHETGAEAYADDYDDADRLDRSDLIGSRPELGESLPMDDDFDLPGFDDDPSDTGGFRSRSDFIVRLNSELERSASFNEDLALLLFSTGDDGDGGIRESFVSKDLVADLGGGQVGVIEVSRNLDEALETAEDFLRQRILQTGIRSLRVGIASRNGRLIAGEELWNEAENALRRTDDAKNIVAFRSDPEKYREYIKNQPT